MLYDIRKTPDLKTKKDVKCMDSDFLGLPKFNNSLWFVDKITALKNFTDALALKSALW